MKKLRSKKGESLVESLVAILIFTLSSIMLFTMISAASDLNSAAKRADEEHRREMIYAEQGEDFVREEDLMLQSGVNGSGVVTFSLEGSGEELCRYSVSLYRLDEDSLYSYSME